MPPIAVALLARELGIRPNDVLRLAKKVDVNVTRVGAYLAPAQADKIRAAYKVELKASEKAQRRPPTALHVGLHRAVVAEPPREPAPLQPGVLTDSCSCCHLRLPGGKESAPRYCDHCGDHYETPAETGGRRLARLEDHATRMTANFLAARARAYDLEEKMKGAMRSRDSWRAVLVEVALPHEEKPGGGCACGAAAFPCQTLQAIDRSNRGVARQVERFCSLSDDERERELYGDRFD